MKKGGPTAMLECRLF